MLVRDGLASFFPRFAPPKKTSRVALLYAKFLGINGTLFQYKVLLLQFMTIVLQVIG